MGRQIIKQPNGLYAVWSSVVDGFVMTDCTRRDLIDDWSKEEAERVEKRVQDVCNDLDAGGKPYFQFTRTWENAIAEHEQRHGKLANDPSAPEEHHG